MCAYVINSDGSSNNLPILVMVTDVFCYLYLTINNSANKLYFSTKFDDRFSNLLGIKCAKFYSDLFRFDIPVVRCVGGYFFRTQCT